MPCTTGRGGGIGLFIRDDLCFKLLSHPYFYSFESISILWSPGRDIELFSCHFCRNRKLLPQDTKSFPQVSWSLSQVSKSLPQDRKLFPQIIKSLPQDRKSFPQVKMSFTQV